MNKKLKFSLLIITIIIIIASSFLVSSINAATATIDTGTTQQYIRGFGAANIIGWREDLTSSDRTTAFSVSNGLGLSVLRVRVSPNSADWAVNKATIDAAKANGATVIASSWTAPNSMKTNNNAVGGTLNTSSYAAYAAHLKDFCTTVGGVDAISPINEPNIDVSYESMKMSAAEVAAFVAAQGKNCGAPIFAPEPFNMDQSYMNQYLSNSGAKANTTYMAGHIYGVSPSTYNPGKEVWMTEHYIDSNTNGNDWNKSMKVAKEIHDCMNSGYSMYVWWYIKRFYGPIEEDGTITKTGYVMSNYAKYVRPGFNKVSCTANPSSGVFTTAYKKGSDLVVVAVNQNSSSTSQTFNISGMSINGFKTYTTSSSQNHSAGTINASGSSFTVNLPASSITTLVSSSGTPTTTSNTISPPPTTVNTTTTANTTTIPPTTIPSTTTIVPTTSQTASNFSVNYKIQNDWGSGATVSIDIKNNGPAINGWTLAFTFPGNQKITNLWNATFTQSGAAVTIKNTSWNASIATGQSISFGFNLSYTGTNSAPTSFTVNGV